MNSKVRDIAFLSLYYVFFLPLSKEDILTENPTITTGDKKEIILQS